MGPLRTLGYASVCGIGICLCPEGAHPWLEVVTQNAGGSASRDGRQCHGTQGTWPHAGLVLTKRNGTVCWALCRTDHEPSCCIGGGAGGGLARGCETK